MKPVLMIHEVSEQMFNLPLGDYTLTFDDGLYSQFYYLNEFKKFNTEMIFFISTGIVCNSIQSTEFPACRVAHEKAFAGNYEDYMTLAQVRQLVETPNVTVGGHSNSHTRLTQFNSLVDKVAYIESDTLEMITWFESNLKFKPTAFCFPYNDDMDGLYKGLLRKHGLTSFYGKERIKVEDVLLATV